MMKDTEYYTKKTLASWDEAAARHASINASLAENVATEGFNNLNPDFDALVDNYGVDGKSVVQVCCNNGIDLLSVKKKGAGRCLGIDGSQPFIDQARELADTAGHPDVEFCQTDIYELPHDYQAAFDIVIITVGVWGWMPDMNRFMEICVSLLVPGGVLLVEEIHPILGMYEEGSPSYIDSSYFNTEPFRETDGLDYFTYEKYEAKENYWFHHQLGDVLMAAVDHQLQLEQIKELHYNVGNFCADLEHVANNPPLGINLAWRKEG